MIRDIAQAASETPPEANLALLKATGGSLVFGLTIGQVNQYLQAGAFLTTMIVGVAAFLYYRAKTREIEDARDRRRPQGPEQ